MENNIRVFKLNEYEWYASKWSLEETNAWYENQIDDNDLEEVRECNLDKEGTWWITKDEKDLRRLGDSDEIIGFEIVNGFKVPKIRIGDLTRIGSEVYKFISFREAIKFDLDFKEPYCISCTEW